MRRRVIALAGLFQASALAKAIATHGSADQGAMDASVNSIYALEAETVEAVFGGLGGVRMGLSLLVEHFTAGRRDLDHLRCVMTLMQLAKKLDADPDLTQQLRDGVAAAKVHAQDPALSPSAQLVRLGNLYLGTISTLSPRVVVHGNPLYLQQERFVHRVRAMLLAGVRAGVLWQQLGGSRLQLLLRGRALLAAARRLRHEIEP